MTEPPIDERRRPTKTSPVPLGDQFLREKLTEPSVDDQELEKELSDPDAIKDIMIAYDYDEQTAREIWQQIGEEVRDLKRSRRDAKP